MPVRLGDVDGVEAERLEAARARARFERAARARAAARGGRRGAARACPPTSAAKPSRTNAIAELEGRDLGQVERVVDVDPVAGELDGGMAVDGEVAERVRRGHGRRDQSGQTAQ